MTKADEQQEQGTGRPVVCADTLNAAVVAVERSIQSDPASEHLHTPRLPDRDRVTKLLDRFMWLLFPGFFGPREISPDALSDHLKAVMGRIAVDLQVEVEAALRYEETLDGTAGSKSCAERAVEVVHEICGELPEIRRLLRLDVQAAFDGDPAARHTDETILCYPGLLAISVHRVAHELFKMGVPLIPRMMSERAHSKTGIDIHPGAQIGERFFVDHGTGVVIGETAEIGNNCKLYQGVTLGATAFVRDETGRLKRGIKRHPTLKDNVTVFAGASILGGETVIGEGSIINGGVFLTHSVPPEHVVRAPKADVRLRSAPGAKKRQSKSGSDTSD